MKKGIKSAGWESNSNHWHSSHNSEPLHHKIHTVRMTNWPFYLNCVKPGVSVVASVFLCGGAWHSKNWQNSTDLYRFMFQFGGAWSFVWGAKPSRGDRTVESQWKHHSLQEFLVLSDKQKSVLYHLKFCLYCVTSVQCHRDVIVFYYNQISVDLEQNACRCVKRLSVVNIQIQTR